MLEHLSKLTIVFFHVAWAILFVEPIPKLHLDKVKIERQIFQDWYEQSAVVNGVKDPMMHEYLSWHFKAVNPEAYTLKGEVQYNVHLEAVINITTKLWRIDIVDKDQDDKLIVLPGIFKFENGSIV